MKAGHLTITVVMLLSCVTLIPTPIVWIRKGQVNTQSRRTLRGRFQISALLDDAGNIRSHFVPDAPALLKKREHHFPKIEVSTLDLFRPKGNPPRQNITHIIIRRSGYHFRK